MQRQDDHQRVFEDLYRHIDKIKPDFVINTGDTAHSKTTISPEFVEVCSNHFREVANRCKYIVTLGNHDLNLSNASRQDAITPIVRSLDHKNIIFLKKSGVYPMDVDKERINFYVYGIADQDYYPKFPGSMGNHLKSINIGLFHGSVAGCKTDTDWVMQNTEQNLSLFDGLDYVLMGDIHKQQSFNGGKIAYAGSLLQNNFGEDVNKGFLLWEIQDKNNFSCTPIYLNGSKKFYTIKANDDLTLPDFDVEKNSNVRILSTKSLSYSEQEDLKKNSQEKYKSIDVIVPPCRIEELPKEIGFNEQLDNLRELPTQEKLIREFLSDKTQEQIENVLEINRNIKILNNQEDDLVARNVSWKIDKIVWNGLFQYGEGNVLDFTKLGNFVGLFSTNGIGKSNLLDSINYSLFNKTSSGISKNVFIINDKLESAESSINISVGTKEFVVDRSIKKIKKKGKIESKGSNSFFEVIDGKTLDECREENNKSGIDRVDTDKEIQKQIGTFDDFCLTSFYAQENPYELLSCKETKRKEILYRFLDLNFFEEKRLIAKEELKNLKNQINSVDLRILKSQLEDFKKILNNLKHKEASYNIAIQMNEENLRILEIKLTELSESKSLGAIKKANEIFDVDQSKITLLEKSFLKAESLVKNYQPLKEVEKCGPPKQLHEQSMIVRDINNELLKLEIDNLEFQERLKILPTVPCKDLFPLCRFLVEANKAKNSISKLVYSIELLKSKLKDETKKLEVLQLEQKKWEEYQKYFNDSVIFANLNLSFQNSKMELEKNLLQKKVYQENLSLISESLTIQKIQVEILKTKEITKQNLKNDRNKLLSVVRAVGSVESSIDLTNRKIIETELAIGKYSNYELYDYVMGKDGIPSLILGTKIPKINEEIVKILSSGVNFGAKIEYNPETQSFPLYFIDNVNSFIRPLELASGAQKFIASLAIRTALLRVSSLPRCNILFVDEGFGKLHSDNYEAISKIFNVLKMSFEHVFVISHLDFIKDMVDDIVDISIDKNGMAHIEVG